MDAGPKGGISETFQWLLGSRGSPRVRHCHGNPAWPGGQEPGTGPHGREAEPGTGPRFCRPRGWPRLRRRWGRERGTTWHPCSGPIGRLRWQIPRSPLAGVSEAYGARTQAFLLDKSHLNPPSLWPWASHTTLMSLFPHLQNGAKNSSLRRVARMILLGSFRSRGWYTADSVHGHCEFPPPGKALGACQDGKPGGKRMTPPARAVADSQPSPAHGLRLGQQHKNNTLPEQPGPQCKPWPSPPLLPSLYSPSALLHKPLPWGLQDPHVL